MRKVLVTGANGYIGRHVLKKLVNSNEKNTYYSYRCCIAKKSY